MKRNATLVFLPALIATLALGTQVFAQSATVSGNVGVGVSAVTGPGTTNIIGPVVPPSISPPSTQGGFVQFNNLTVESVSGTNAPAQIIATLSGPNPAVSNGSAGSSGSASASSAISTEPLTCMQFDSENAAAGKAIPCPMPPPTPAPSNVSGSGGAPGPAPIDIVPPIDSYQYQIDISASTELMLRDRTPATLSDFSQDDQINVFGYYNADGSIEAYLVRDTSKPLETQSMQLNNVTLVSMSATTPPATLAVTQAQGSPCLGYQGNAPAMIVCPMGISSFSLNSGTANVTPPTALAPNWMMLRKYVVNVDSQTIILDRNRTQLSLSNLNAGDELNVYGETSDNGQTIDADIIRDLSIPLAPTIFTGTVSQVNPDGSFVIQTDNGQTLTAQNPISVGERVTLQGLLNATQNLISQITQMTVSSNTVAYPPTPKSPTTY